MFPWWHYRLLTIPKAVVRRESRHMSTLLEQIPFWQNGLFLVLMIHTRKCLWPPAPRIYTRYCKFRVLQYNWREGNEQELIENKDIDSSTESPGEEFGNLFARRACAIGKTRCTDKQCTVFFQDFHIWTLSHLTCTIFFFTCFQHDDCSEISFQLLSFPYESSTWR